MFRSASLALSGPLALIDAFLLIVLAASRRLDAEAEGVQLRFLVLIPAHDEEAQIEQCLAGVANCRYPSDRVRVVVVADNCADGTAIVARRAGAEVLEREDAKRLGKGHALNWGLDRLRDDRSDAILVLDADCVPDGDLLAALAAVLGAGADAVQAVYEVANAGDSSSAAVRSAAFTLMNNVRPAGRDALGASAGLLGTGMALQAPLLQEMRFDASSLVEDADLHIRLILRGCRVRFTTQSSVRSDMPSDAAASDRQQARWEGGRGALIGRHAGRLAKRSVRGDLVAAFALVDLFVPPMSLLAVGHVSALAMSVRGGGRPFRLAAANLGALTAFVLAGLASTGAPREVYRGLAGAPVLVVRKLGLAIRLATRGAPKHWERTARG